MYSRVHDDSKKYSYSNTGLPKVLSSLRKLSKGFKSLRFNSKQLDIARLHQSISSILSNLLVSFIDLLEPLFTC